MFVMIISVSISFAMGNGDEREDEDEEQVATYTAGKVKLQLILVNSITAVYLLVIPRYTFPETFDIHDFKDGENVIEQYGAENITRGIVVWCLMLGIVL